MPGRGGPVPKIAIVASPSGDPGITEKHGNDSLEQGLGHVLQKSRKRKTHINMNVHCYFLVSGFTRNEEIPTEHYYFALNDINSWDSNEIMEFLNSIHGRRAQMDQRKL